MAAAFVTRLADAHTRVRLGGEALDVALLFDDGTIRLFNEDAIGRIITLETATHYNVDDLVLPTSFFEETGMRPNAMAFGVVPDVLGTIPLLVSHTMRAWPLRSLRPRLANTTTTQGALVTLTLFDAVAGGRLPHVLMVRPAGQWDDTLEATLARLLGVEAHALAGARHARLDTMGDETCFRISVPHPV